MNFDYRLLMVGALLLVIGLLRIFAPSVLEALYVPWLDPGTYTVEFDVRYMDTEGKRRHRRMHRILGYFMVVAGVLMLLSGFGVLS